MSDLDMSKEELSCVDPDVGEAYLNGYVAETLTDEQRQEFEDHLYFCLKCREDLEYLRWLVQQIKISPPENLINALPETLRQEYLAWTKTPVVERSESPGVSQSLSKTPVVERSESPGVSQYKRERVQDLPPFKDVPLTVTSISTPKIAELIHVYQDTPLMERLAASTGDSSGRIFPVTIKYAGNQVIGEFRRRAGQLFYRLVHCTIEGVTYACTLTYTSPADPTGIRTFEFQEGEEKRLGDFREFVPSNTIQGMLEAIKQFQLKIKKNCSATENTEVTENRRER